MTSSSRAIVVDYEENGARVEDIAMSMEVGVEAVEAVLLQFSSKYRKDTEEGRKEIDNRPTGDDSREVISDSEYKEICQIYKSIALNTDDERLRARVCANLIDEKKGRKDWRERALNSGKGISPMKITVFVLNRALKKSREDRLEKVIDLVSKEVE